MSQSSIILGIDPGLASTGYAVIEAPELKLRDYGLISTEAKTPAEKRLENIGRQLQTIINHYHPKILAIEELFFARNTTTALSVSQARGVVLFIAQRNHLKIREFKPSQVKQAVTGYGKADKKQIQQMLKIILKLKELPWPDDAADALAVAICCGNSKSI